ncbi:hypothetical protein P9112_002529 [Eukaryota sp. TZLM1-RC]
MYTPFLSKCSRLDLSLLSIGTLLFILIASSFAFSSLSRPINHTFFISSSINGSSVVPLGELFRKNYFLHVLVTPVSTQPLDTQFPAHLTLNSRSNQPKSWESTHNWHVKCNGYSCQSFSVINLLYPSEGEYDLFLDVNFNSNLSFKVGVFFEQEHVFYIFVVSKIVFSSVFVLLVSMYAFRYASVELKDQFCTIIIGIFFTASNLLSFFADVFYSGNSNSILFYEGISLFCSYFLIFFWFSSLNYSCLINIFVLLLLVIPFSIHFLYLCFQLNFLLYKPLEPFGFDSITFSVFNLDFQQLSYIYVTILFLLFNFLLFSGVFLLSKFLVPIKLSVSDFKCSIWNKSWSVGLSLFFLCFVFVDLFQQVHYPFSGLSLTLFMSVVVNTFVVVLLILYLPVKDSNPYNAALINEESLYNNSGV